MKRKALEEAGGLPTRTKRQQIELPEADEPAAAPAAALAPNPTDSDMPDDNDNDDSSSTTSSTPQPPDQTQPLTPAATSIPPSAASTTSTSTTRRRARKFPSDLKTIKCTYTNCPKTFNRPARLAAHLRSHTNDRPHRCPYAGCGKAYLEEKHLAQHIKGTHTHERRYACAEPGCGRAFVTATRLRRHAAVHEGAERFRCRGWEGCALSFRKHQTLQRHVRVAHLGLPAYVCGFAGPPDECREGFDTAAALRRHVEREHGELRFWCEECGGGGGEGDADDNAEEGDGRRVGFRTLLLLQAHMRKEHVNCVFCDVKFGSQAELERHVDMYHSGKTVEDRKTVECPWEGCDKKFTRASNLNTHIRTAHEGLRFVCGQVDTFESEGIGDWNWMEEGCGQAFVSKVKLEEHVRYVHLGMRRPPRLYTVQSAQPGEADEMSAAVPTKTIPCLVGGCPAMFVRHHDLDRHLRKEHHHVHAEGPEDDSIDPQLQGPSETASHDEQFWIESVVPLADDQAGFEPDWVEMRRLIDLDALVEANE